MRSYDKTTCRILKWGPVHQRPIVSTCVDLFINNWQLSPQEQTSVKLDSKYSSFVVWDAGKMTKTPISSSVAYCNEGGGLFFKQFIMPSPFFNPPLQRSWKGVYWFHLVRLSVCGQNHVRSVSSTILVRSISYLHILSSNFRRFVACKVCFKVIKFEILANSLNLWLWLCLLLTWDPIWLNSMGNHEAVGGILRTKAF